MANLFDLPRYIAVEGPIRVGKSTLSTILAERLNAQRVTDPEQNSFLRAFYEGKPGAAFQAQFTFLVRRFEQLRGLDTGAKSQKIVISDFIFEKDKIFACLNLNDQELETYNRYFNHFREQIPTPDLVIYLQATPEVLKKRLKKKKPRNFQNPKRCHPHQEMRARRLPCWNTPSNSRTRRGPV